MRKIIFFVLVLLCGKQAITQCNNFTQLPTGTVNIEHLCASQSFSTGTGRFAVLDLLGSVTGDQYRFTSNVVTDFLTLRDNLGNVIAFGTSPLVFTQPATVLSTVRLHTNQSNACGSSALSRTITTLLLNNCPPSPGNDECANATLLTVNNDNTCTSSTTGTTVNATQSQVACTGNADDDVWYSFVATAPTHKITVT